MPETAFADLAERLTRALLTGDFALYRSVMAMPLRVVPRGGQPYVLETEAALQHDFDLYATAVRTAGVTDIWREVVRVTKPGAGNESRGDSSEIYLWTVPSQVRLTISTSPW